ncbi:MAG: hypothetical protein R3B37_11120 [Nitrospira sp.]|nr:hypothetical protein [Nitrospira sp.]
MSRFRLRAVGIWTLMSLGLVLSALADSDGTVFAVVSDIPKDKTRISTKALVDGGVADLKLLPGELIVGNTVWRSLEICHALKVEGSRTGDGFKVTSARVLDASMLPMALQGYAGDCLIKKALEIAPMAD